VTRFGLFVHHQAVQVTVQVICLLLVSEKSFQAATAAVVLAGKAAKAVQKMHEEPAALQPMQLQGVWC
jgi:hypothetical protein